MGRSFWLGALGGERWTLEAQLHALERKEFVRRERRSTVAGESEYSFRHALVREVAYEQIPRGQRADKHLHAAGWIASLGRIEDHAEMLAHHYLAAVELARAASRPIGGIAESARDVLIEAGDRASSLSSFEAGVRFYSEALELGGLDAATEADVRFRHARACYYGDAGEREAALEEARAALLATDNAERAAEADALLAELWWHRGDRARSSQHLARAHELVRDHAASASKARVLGQVSRYHMLAGEEEEAISTAREVLVMAQGLGLDELGVQALVSIGTARVNLGDPSGVEDLERGIEIATAGRFLEAARAYNNLGACFAMLGDLRRASVEVDEALAVGERLGNVVNVRFSRSFRLWLRFERGEWNEAMQPADAFLAACDAGDSHYHEGGIRLCRARTRLARDDVNGAIDDVQKALPHVRRAADPQALVPALTRSALIFVETDNVDEALDLSHEALALPPAGLGNGRTDLAWVAHRLGLTDDVARWIRQGGQWTWVDAAEALLRGRFAAAADVFDEIGAIPEAARARLRAGDRDNVERALAFYRSVGATRYIREAEALLAEAS